MLHIGRQENHAASHSSTQHVRYDITLKNIIKTIKYILILLKILIVQRHHQTKVGLTEKDSKEINSVQVAFAEAVLHLCHFHVFSAVDRRLSIANLWRGRKNT